MQHISYTKKKKKLAVGTPMAANYVQTYLCKLLRKFMFETSLLNDFHEKTGKKENLNMAAFYRF